MVNINFDKKFLLKIFYLTIFFIGVILRIKYFCINDILNEDECRLAISLSEAKNFFLPLFAAQSAPPLFSVLTNFMINIFGTNDYAYKIIPFISSILSLVMFYYLSQYLFKKELCIACSFFLFSLSVPVILFSSVFKQYSSDILIAIICLYFLSKIKINNLQTKQILILTIILAILPFISLTSVFFIVAFFIINFNRKIIGPFVIFCMVMSFYYYFNLHPSSINMNNLFPHYWDDGFISFSLKDLFKIIAVHLKFLFIPNKLILFQMILLIIGAGYAIKDKKFHLLIVSLSLVLLASLLHIYPFFGRAAIYTVVIFILLMIKPLDTNLKPYLYIFGTLFILSFFNYFSVFSALNEHCVVNESPKKLMSILKDKYDKESDLILCNVASEASYIFYSHKLKFNDGKLLEIPPKDNLDKYFSGLDKSKVYWLYLIKDYNKAPIYPVILEWVNKQNTLESYKDKNSYLIKLEIPKN